MTIPASSRVGPGRRAPRPNAYRQKFQDLACDLVIGASKMDAICQAMHEYLSHSEHNDEYLFALNSVMGDLIDEAKRLAEHADVLAYSKANTKMRRAAGPREASMREAAA